MDSGDNIARGYKRKGIRKYFFRRAKIKRPDVAARPLKLGSTVRLFGGGRGIVFALCQPGLDVEFDVLVIDLGEDY